MLTIRTFSITLKYFLFAASISVGATVDDLVKVEAVLLEGKGKAYLNEEDGTSQVIEHGRRTVFLYIKNASDRGLRVPTKGFDLKWKKLKSGASAELVLTWTMSEDASKRKLVVPEERFGIAELLPGESACLEIPIPKEWPDLEYEGIRMDIQDRLVERYKLDYISRRSSIEK
jgi:hypothetical protein